MGMHARLRDRWRKRWAALSIALGFIPAIPAHAQQRCDLHCGAHRWAVKVMVDQDAARIDTIAHAATVTELRALTVPHSLPRRHGQPILPEDSRVAPIEFTTYDVHAVLVAWKLEKDEDFHLVIANPDHPTETMIVEVPSPTCPDLCSTHQAVRYAALRQRIIDRLGQPRSRIRRLRPGVRVRVIGVGFFDKVRGQAAAAPNGIELHPVLDIRFR